MAILTLRPTGDASIQLSRSAGSYNYTCVDEDPVSDADYVFSTEAMAVNKTDLYSLNTSGSIGPINSVTVYARAKYGTLTLGPLIFVTVNSAFGDGETLTSSWTMFSKTWTVNPATGNAWTWNEILTLVAGIKFWCFNEITTGEGWCSQVYVEVDYTYAPGMKISVDAQWHSCVPKISVGGIWKTCIAGWVSVSNQWKRML
jgi:hypothetical protein